MVLFSPFRGYNGKCLACWGLLELAVARKGLLRKEHLSEDLKDLQNHMTLLGKSKA